MNKIHMTQGKFAGVNALANQQGVIAALALDQRGSLKKMIAQARPDGQAATAAELTEFKTTVVKALMPYASGLLIDPEYGLPALQAKAPTAGVLLAYEQTGYDATVKGRLPDLLPAWSVLRLVAAGANAVKVLLYYNSFDEVPINTVKQAFVERIGGECVAEDVPFFLEIVTYDATIGDEQGLAYALKKPQLVTQAVAEFTQSRYRVDVLKVEAPVNLAFVAGTRTFARQEAYSRQEAMRLFREAAAAATRPFIYLSAGVRMDVFLETLELATEAGVDFAGVLCGRATWQDGVAAYTKQGVPGLEAWLASSGVQNITALNTQLAWGAKPWWTVYGGHENIKVDR